MMKNKLLYVYTLLLATLLVNATTIGSDTAVTRFNNQLNINNGDIITGFSALQGGFILTDTSVTATWNALFSASGSINLLGGTLNLQRDLFTSDKLTLSILGGIIGNGYTLNLAPDVIFLGNTCVPALLLTGPPAGNIPFVPLGSVGWSFDDQFVAIAGSGLANQRFNGTSLTPLSVTSGISAVLAWHPSAYYLATGSCANIISPFNQTIILYSVDPFTGVLTQTSSQTIASASSSCSSVAWHPSGSHVALTGTRLPITYVYPVTAGILGTAITNNTSGNALGGCDWALTGSVLAVGAITTVKILSLVGSSLNLLFSFTTGGTFTTAVKWNPAYTNILAVGLNDGTIQIWQCDFTANTATLLTSILIPNFALRLLDWSRNGNCLLIGGANTLVSNIEYLYSYYYNATSPTLTLSSSSTFSDPGGGGGGGRYSPINNYVAQSMTLNSTTVLSRISVPAGLNPITLSNLAMVMNSDISLQGYTITFSGNCTIHGNNNSLSLAGTSTGQFLIAPNSTLTLKNVTMNDITAGSIQMLASNSNLVLDNSNLIINGTYSFTQGSLIINKDVTFSGPNATFLFSSPLPCVIQSKSQLFLDELVTWSHVPSTNSRDLLQCIDSSSCVYLNGASLVTTRTGLNLTKGTLMIDRASRITSDAQVAAEGVALGDGTNATNNMAVQIYPAAKLEVTKGILVDNNI